jgi:hypothetical protein
VKSPAARPSRSSPNAGFTLLEILLASLLASVVLVALWTLSDVYLRLFISGKRKIEETQLVRGLTQQIAKDLVQVIQLPEEASPGTSVPGASVSTVSGPGRSVQTPRANTEGSPRGISRPQSGLTLPSDVSPVVGRPLQAVPVARPNSESDKRPLDRNLPKFGLFGTKQALRLIVLETDPRTTREPTDLAEILPQPGQARPPIASELRTIEYSFSSPIESYAGDNQHPPGLIRRQWAWETWNGMRMASLRGADSGSSSSMLPEPNAEWTAEDALLLESDRSLVHVPQVVGLEFSYYDGDEWQEEWNSWERKRLPLLVEVLLQIEVNKDSPAAARHERRSESTESSTSLTVDNSSGESSTTSGTLYRRLIHLPFAESQAGPYPLGNAAPTTDLARTSSQPEARRP